MNEALDYCNNGGIVEIHTRDSMRLCGALVGKVVTYEKQFDSCGEMCGEEICVVVKESGHRAHLNEWEIETIYAK